MSPWRAEEYDTICANDECKALALEKKIRAGVCLVEGQTTHTGKDGELQEAKRWKYIIAVDIAYASTSSVAVASSVLYDVTQKSLLDQCTETGCASFAYQPGFLAFREVPLLVRVVEKLFRQASAHGFGHVKPDSLLLCDGHGLAHPRFCGVACHMGVLLQMPCVGVAKSYFVGSVASESDDFLQDLTCPLSTVDSFQQAGHAQRHEYLAKLGQQRGSTLPLAVQGYIVGVILRTQDNIRPLFVSVGHNIAIAHAAQVVLSLCSSYRQPDPIRMADHLGRMELKRLESGAESVCQK